MEQVHVVRGKILKNQQLIFHPHVAHAQAVEILLWKADMDGTAVVNPTIKEHMSNRKCGLG